MAVPAAFHARIRTTSQMVQQQLDYLGRTCQIDGSDSPAS